MMKDLKRISMVIIVGIAILLQLMNPTRVHADGETTPQPSDTPVETSTSVPTEAPTEVLVTETATPEPVATDAVTPTVDPVETSTPAPATDAPEPTSVPTEPPMSEAIQQLPGRNKVIVLDKFNRPLALASQAAANTVATGDPIWCPAGQLPLPGFGGCTVSYPTLSALIGSAGSYINSQNVNGTIWITAGTVPDGAPITLDGSVYTNWANYGLNLLGGWSGLFGDTTNGIASSVFSVPITISNWNGTLGLSVMTTTDLNINNTNGVVVLAGVRANNININGPRGRIDVYNSGGNLNINNANINNNGLYSAGINIHTLVGDLNISNSAFHGNGYDGVWMDRVNNVTINNSQFYGNANNGIGINNVQNVFISNSSFDQNNGNGAAVLGAVNVDIGSSTFNNNIFHGISVANTTGNVKLADITATANPGTSGDGAYIDNTWGAGNVTLTGTNDFSNHSPWNSGMYILSNGLVSLSGITSNNNGRGVNISRAGSVEITGGTFNNNVCDCEGSGAYVVSAGNVSVGQSAFYRDTLYINSNGDVSVSDVSIDRASGFGLGVQTGGGNVTISNTRVTNTISNSNNPAFPWGDGADIFTNGGNLSVTGSQFNNNAFDGLYAVVNHGTVTVTDSHFNNNQVGGLDIFGASQVDVKTTEFTANGPYYDLFTACNTSIPPSFYNYLSLFFPDSIPTSTPSAPTFIDILVDNNCQYSNYSLRVSSPLSPPINNVPPPQAGKDRKNKPTFFSGGNHFDARAESHVELFLCWDNQITHKINLPNGDKVEIICPVRGKASISRLDNTTLPADLPDGYTFASAFQVDISQPDFGAGPDQRKSIDVISEGGYIKASFVAPSIEIGGIYSILYWDPATASWIPLKDFIRDPGGSPHIFSLHSENPADPKKILSGVNFLSRIVPQRVEVSTNFPGIFVLAVR